MADVSAAGVAPTASLRGLSGALAERIPGIRIRGLEEGRHATIPLRPVSLSAENVLGPKDTERVSTGATFPLILSMPEQPEAEQRETNL